MSVWCILCSDVKLVYWCLVVVALWWEDYRARLSQLFTVAGLTQKFSDILTYRYVDPATFNADDTSQVRGGREGKHILWFCWKHRGFQSVWIPWFSVIIICVQQVQIYRALAAVFKQVVDDIETDFKPHRKAQTWQENLQHRIYDFLNSDDARKPEAVTERESQRDNGWTDWLTDCFIFN